VGGAPSAIAKMALLKQPLSSAFTPISLVSPTSFAAQWLGESEKKRMIETFCANVVTQFKRYKWSDDACGKVNWKTAMKSQDGHPLIFAEFGTGPETTLLLGGVHPDELTPVPIAFRVARYLFEHPDALQSDSHVIIAPLVNPDGFIRKVPTRTNANGVDLNRNFFTFDWYNKAKKLWQDRREGSPAHFPGYFPNSEVETIFQIQMIDEFHPDKILSIHAPLGFLDYDGPGDGQPQGKMSATQMRARRLVTTISEKSQNYKVVDYTFFPGSLGYYAGNERHIPTVTLEFEKTDPKVVDLYWKQFLPGIMQSIHYPFTHTTEPPGGGNETPFSTVYLPAPKRTI
jgi:protein MpaA